MNENSNQKARAHNTVVGILTVASIGTITGSIALGWEFWVPPLIVCGMIAAWFFHVNQYGTWTMRENYYLVFTMLLSFYHGIHYTSIFEVVVVSALLMVNVTLFKRTRFVTLVFIEFLVLMTLQIIMGIRHESITFDVLTVSKLTLHIIGEICIYKGLKDAITNNRIDSEELEERNKEKEISREQMEDFLVNISHELRTPVNVVNGISTLILKKEDNKDVTSIRDAGLRLSRQIEDIQDYSEIQRDDLVLEEDKYMITSVLNDIISNYMSWDEIGNLDLIVDLDPGVPAMLMGDAGKIRKVIWHLLNNAVKFTRKGGIYLKVSCIKRSYGINLLIEVKDTGIGISRKNLDKISSGLYQIDRRRNRSTGGIGLGFSIVYGFVRRMNGFVNIDSERGKGTDVSVSIAQAVIDPSPCLNISEDGTINVIFYVIPDRYAVDRLRDFYRDMASNIASGLKVNLYSASDIEELKKLIDKGDITHVFMGEYEYENAHEYFDEMAEGDVKVAVCAREGFMTKKNSRVIVMRKPLYGYSVVKVLNGETQLNIKADNEEERKPLLDGVRALVVDDEPMNLVVATGLFREYNMIIDTADSGKEALAKYLSSDYDLVFMDHMMPEMDGVEAMKRLRDIAAQKGKVLKIVALTANAVSGAREMFLREGFDGFISKPINIADFERVMNRILPDIGRGGKGGHQ